MKNISGNDVSINIEGEDNEVELLGCGEIKGKYVCKSKFKNPITLYRLTRKYLNRLVGFVKFAYKNPDKWDDYFDDRKK